jgi:Alkaline phosphatase
MRSSTAIISSFEGKWTGLVTTTRITHASPAAGYAHVSDRDWEAYMPSRIPSQIACDDIAKQLIRDEENQHIRVTIVLYSLLSMLKHLMIDTRHHNPIHSVVKFQRKTLTVDR